MAKVTNDWGPYHLDLRLTVSPLDLANAFERSRDWEAALGQWDRALASNPGDIPLRVRRSRAAIYAGFIDRAIDDLNAVIDKIPDNVPLVRQRAELLAQLGRWDEVQEDYRRLAADQPEDWNLRFAVGQIYAHVGRQTIVHPTSPWRWLHPNDGSDPATSDEDFHRTFFAIDFDDSVWQVDNDQPSSMGGFGFGDPAAVDIGASPLDLQTTAYFRHRFTVDENYDRLAIRLRRDDGVIIYLDGVEVGRSNVSATKEERFQTTADGSSSRGQLREIGLPGSLQPGEHVLAISLHNRGGSSDDMFLGEISLHGYLEEDHEPRFVPLKHPAEFLGRAVAYAEIGWIDQSAADIDAGLKLATQGDGSFERMSEEFTQLVKSYTAQGDVAMGIRILDWVLAARPDDAELLIQRGGLLARTGQWQLAADDLSKVVELAPKMISPQYELAALLLETGQQERYREHCRKMIARFRESEPEESNPRDLGKALFGCYWSPDSLNDWNAVEDLVNRSLQVGSGLRPHRVMGKGIYLYRAGRFNEAIEWIPQGFDGMSDPGKGRGMPALAMAYHRIGEHDKAIETLEEVEALLASPFDNLQSEGDLGERWHEWLATRILYREAVGLIRAQANR